MSTIVKKWGNSLGVRIPKQIADALHISSGTEVDIEVRKQEIIIKNHHSGLDELLEQNFAVFVTYGSNRNIVFHLKH